MLTPQTSFCEESAGDITKCWLFAQAIVPNGVGTKWLKFVLRSNGCGALGKITGFFHLVKKFFRMQPG